MFTGVHGRPLTTHELRRITADIILRVLRAGEITTASELMGHTGLSRTAIHEVCADLIELGWIKDVRPDRTDPARNASAGRGRPPRRYQFDERAGAIVAVDLGVNTVALHVTDLRGASVAVRHRHFADPSLVDRRLILDELVDGALVEAGFDPSAVLQAIVGVPMPVSDSGTVQYPPQQRVIELAREWAESRDWPVQVENDANLAALAERRIGAAQEFDNVITLLVGERMGAGIVMGGRLARGEHGSSGELRFVTLIPTIQSESLGVGRHARELADQALAGGWATKGLIAAARRADAGGISAADVFRAADNGDESAITIVRIVCERLAMLIAVLATVLDPGIVVISGGIAEAGELLATTTQKLLPASMMDNPPQVAVSQLGSDVVVHGGISLALEHLDAHLLDDQLP